MGASDSNNNDKNQLQNETKLKCTIHENKGMNEYIYKLDVNIPNLDPPEFIIIVDKSGSMGSSYKEIISRIIPQVLNSLRYENRKIHLITFASDIEYLYISQFELKKLKPRSNGNTYMAKSYDFLEKILCNSKKKCNNFRILIISDGKLHDQEETKQKGLLLYEKYKNAFKINSQCIRLYTNSKEADSEGMASFLKFNNVKNCDFIIHSSDDLSNLSIKIENLFKDDGLNGNNLKIIGDNVNLKDFPYEETSSNIKPFKNGKYIIYGDKNKPLFIEFEKKKIPLECEKGGEIKANNYQCIASKKINNMIQRFLINRLLNSELCEKENELILNYFNNLCKKTIKEDENDKTLEYLQKKINNINSIKKINNLKEDEKSYFIREIDEENIDYNKYSKNYNDKDFNNKVKKYKSSLGVIPLYHAFLLYYALPKVTLADKAIIIGCLGYLISPFDLIPDFIPIIGFMDDIGALAWASYRIASKVDNEVKEKAKRKVMSFCNLTEEEINNIF